MNVTRKEPEIKIHAGQEYVRITSLDSMTISYLRKHPEFDRTKVLSLHTCCYNFEEHVLKEHFLYLTQT